MLHRKGTLLSVLITVCFLTIEPVRSTRISGTYNTDEFFRFLVKFGFQKTDRHRQKDTYGHIFGNITSKSNFSRPITLAVLDRRHFLEYYGNRTVENKNLACELMFKTLEKSSYDSHCNDGGQDFLRYFFVHSNLVSSDKIINKYYKNCIFIFRRIPCPKNQLCSDEDVPGNVVKGYQFTYAIEDIWQPKFWYLSIVSCYRNDTTCKWHHYDGHDELEYDIWLVNGNPNSSGLNTLTYQFSYDRQNTIELYTLFFVCYIILVPLQLYAVRMQKHPVTRLFTASLLLEFVAICLILTHVSKFMLDGVGYEQLEVAGDIFDILSRVKTEFFY